MTVGSLFTILHDAKHTKKWQVVFWLNTALLLYLTLMPSVHYKVSFDNIDKVFHIIGFGSFAFFCNLAFPRMKILIVILLSSLLGFLVEVVQSFLPYRDFSFWDMVADLIGILAAVLFLWFTAKIKGQKNVHHGGTEGTEKE